MSNPFEPPSAQPDPGSQPLPPPYPQQHRQPSPAPQQQWQPSPPASRQGNGLAITALVVACLAMVMVLGVIVLVALGGIFSSIGDSGGLGGDLKGTAPQVVAGEHYPGQRLASEVTRVIRGDGGDVESMTCPESQPAADVTTACHGVVDSYDTEVTVTFEDDLGHFTLVERDPSVD